MILAEGTLEQADAALERQGRPAVHRVGIRGDAGGGDVGGGKVQVFHDVGDDHVTVVLGLVQVLVGRVQRLVDPRDVAVLDQLVVVEIGAEQAGDARVVVPDRIRHGRIRVVLDEVVHVADAAPAPGRGSGGGVGSLLIGADAHLGRVVVRDVDPVGAAVIGEIVVEAVGVVPQTRLVTEDDGAAGDGLRVLLEVAGSGQDTQRDEREKDM